MPQPNILYLHSHDTGRYIQPYGHAIPTPNLQQLADEGALFRKAFCAAPTCSPSRAALLTGQSAHSSGMLGLAHRGFSLNDYRQHLVHTLRTAGYRSTLAGTQHVAANAETIGYDEILDVPNNSARHVAPAAAEFLRSSSTEPFFLSVGFSETHREFPLPPTDTAANTLPPAPLPDTPQTRQDMAAYKESARLLDEGVGTVLQALAESSLAENTLLISTTDHGLAFPGMKCNLTDHGIGVSLIMRGPGGFRGGKVIDAMVSHIDIFPTVCDLIGHPAPSWLQGTSMLPLLDGSRSEIRDELFAEVTYHAAYEPQRAVRTQRYKYIRRYGDRQTPVLPNCDDSPSKQLWLDHGWREQILPEEQLYDLIFDPNEQNNLAYVNTHRETLSTLRQTLDTWMKETDDPLRAGQVSAPKGATVNDSDGLSPREHAHVVE